MEKVLFVDDEPLVLEGYQRSLRKFFQVEIAEGADAGLSTLATHGPFPLIVSDFRMAGMNGTQFLAMVKALAPDSVRMMLSGQADMAAVVDAVNEGAIFRFLNKPCSPETLIKAVSDGIQHYHLIHAEKELLEETLTGSLKALADVLAIIDPEAFGKASRIKRYVQGLAEYMKLPNIWQFEIASSLSQIGYVIAPNSLFEKIKTGESLSPEETQIYEQCPPTGADLLARIPRMQEVSMMIEYQLKHFDGSGTPRNAVKGYDIPLGARLLKVALDFDTLRTKNIPRIEAFQELQSRTGFYDPDVLQALYAVFVPEQQHTVATLELDELEPNMIVGEPITDTTGKVLIPKGQLLTPWMLGRLHQIAELSPITSPMHVIMPVQNQEVGTPDFDTNTKSMEQLASSIMVPSD
ncbi:MAG: response regulator receiver modulated metal-depenent phosphohydrolase [Nitrospirales bacterium]|nr:MAG: response regulator receiver modulated metal-depenent phosphohydrolase [Nitrospirales bacterium]